MVLKKEIVNSQVTFDKQKRAYFEGKVGNGAYCEACEESLRTPSAKWPFSVYKHCFTKKHAKNCLNKGLVELEDIEGMPNKTVGNIL